MSAELSSAGKDSPTDGLAEALYFDSGNRRLFAWLHRPIARRADSGLVVCKPFGYEAVCAHRSVRAFSEAAASLGIPTLRFDYAGTGDSSELDPSTDQVETWIQDVNAAVSELRRVAGVDRVHLLGFRLGALLATLAAGRIKEIGSLILIAPIVSGRRYLRELRTARLAAATSAGPTAGSSGGQAPVAGTEANPIEVGGFMFSAATLAALAQIDLKASRDTPADVLVIDGDTMPGARAWVAELSGLGVRATYRTLPGLIEMIMTAPHFAAVPQQMIAATTDWLAEHVKDSHSAANQNGDLPQVVVPPTEQSTFMILPSVGPRPSGPIMERSVFIKSSATLFGIVTEPEQRGVRCGAAILVNAGADYHIGASGLYVALARRWARQGYIVLRLDLAGLGDSATRIGQLDNVVFPAAAVDDIRSAVEWVRSEYGATEVTLGGLCSGAYHALRAAVVGLPVDRILMVNPETFFWDESMSIHDMNLAEVVSEPTIDRGKLLSIDTWTRLLRGRINFAYLLRRAGRRGLLALESSTRNLLRRLHIHLPHDLGSDLEKIAARGVRMVFVFSLGEPGIALLRMQAGVSLRRLGQSCRMHVIEGADHVFSKLETRKALEDILTDEVFSPRKAGASHGGARDQALAPSR